MATRSFLNILSIKGQSAAKSFIRALERSESMKQKKVIMRKPVHEMNREQMKKLFGDEDGQNHRVLDSKTE